MSGDRDERRSRLKEDFIRERGYWNGFWAEVLRDDPDYFAGYLEFSASPWRHGTLPPKVKEFVYIAIDASATHMFKPGLRIHVQNALKHGATREEIMEVLELTAEIGIHACSAGVPILLEELQRAGIADPRLAQEPPRAAELKQRFEGTVGPWSTAWDGLLKLSPEFFEAYLALATPPRRGGHLSPKERELVLLSLSAAMTHLHLEGMRTHIRNAITHGATADELMEVLQLVSVLGIHGLTLGMPVLLEELKPAA